MLHVMPTRYRMTRRGTAPNRSQGRSCSNSPSGSLARFFQQFPFSAHDEHAVVMREQPEASEFRS